MIRFRRNGWRINQVIGSCVTHVIDKDGVDHPILWAKLSRDMTGEELDAIITRATERGIK